MAITCGRIFRSLRAIAVPTAAIIGFSLLLTWVFILYQPTHGPGNVQKVGWQAWEVITMSDTPQRPAHDSAGSAEGNHAANPEGVDWWNVTDVEDSVDSSSFPLDVWSPLLPHTTGLSEIAIEKCLIPPAYSTGLCSPSTTKKEDSLKGKWVRIPRDLNLGAGHASTYLYMYYRRTRRRDVKLISDIRLLPEDEKPSPADNWIRTKHSLRSGVIGISPLFLWYKAEKTAAEMSTGDRSNLITELDVLYGEDVPWYGFERLEPPTLPQRGRVEPTWLTYRRGVKRPPQAPPLHFNHEGKFKILQVADLHYSVSQGKCRDMALPLCTNSDNITSSLISHVIDAEKPDMVVFTGDQLNGQGSSWDPKSVLAKFAKAVTDKGIPWAAVFGNHDEEDGLPKEEQLQLMRNLPYSLVERGPKDVHGVGNYVLKVKSADPSKTHLLTLYFLDSGSYSRGYLDFLGFIVPTSYDWIREDQINWFLQESASIDQIERPFDPDTAKDLGHAWSEREQVTPMTRRLAKPNALMFFHIPLSETYNKADKNPKSGKLLDVGISGLEPHGNAKDNAGFFEKGLQKAMESDHVAAGRNLEVKVVANGHCHLTENCRRVKGVWMCFGGGGSYSGYGKIGFDRRFRIYDISDYGETIRTYKRTEHDEIIDETILAGKGAAPP